MSRRLKLPVIEQDEPAAATADVLRRSLGGALGQASTTRAGQAVALRSQPERPLVLLLEDGEEAHLWAGQGRVRKVQRDALQDFHGELTSDQAAVGREIARLHALPEGASVALLLQQPPGATGRGVLVEKCRFGGLVRLTDGRLMAVGFRRLWADTSGLN